MTQIKLTKDQIQKLGLSAIGFVVLLYVYFSFFLGPLNKSRVSMETTIKSIETKLAASKGEMSKAANLEREASAATARFATLKSLHPEGAPIAWFPPRMKGLFAGQQVDKVTARLEGTSAYPQTELAGWMKYVWLIELPQTDFATLGKAVAAWENAEPLSTGTRLSIKAVANEPQFQQVSLTSHTTIMKQ
jgi:hypothetical protein